MTNRRTDTPTEASLRDVAGTIATERGYRLVVLFGSTARREPTSRDIDLGIIGPAETELDVLEATTAFIRSLGTSAVDIVDLRRANPVLLMTVARDGVPLFDATGSAFSEFSSLAMRRYADTKKFRDLVRDDLREYARRPDPA
jgi:predicted nucleotidyltransferase